MKILWVTTNFLHPTTKGGQIRTLEMLRRLHARHEIHYVALEDPAHPEGPLRSSEYCTRAYPFRKKIPAKTSPAFFLQLAAGLFSPVPVAVNRFCSGEVRRFLEDLLRKESFDAAVCDFLVPTGHFPGLERAVLFQHNVETMIWRRHAEHASGPARRFYFGLQARRMFRYEREACRKAAHVVAVSAEDAQTMRKLFGASRVSEIPTGVDVDYFARPAGPPRKADLVFVGSMDWLPNIDGISHFVREIYPEIRRRRPDCTLAVVGRTPPEEILALARRDDKIQVTGTVPDVRPWLWGSAVSIVPLRIGGGTRLKIYEAMAAGIPVVSTSVGAEGLQVRAGEDICLADSPEQFAEACLALLENPALAARISRAAHRLVSSSCSWEEVVRRFEQILGGFTNVNVMRL